MRHTWTASYAGAAAIELDIGLTREALVAEIMRTLAANGFGRPRLYARDDHAGAKSGANQDPRNALGPADGGNPGRSQVAESRTGDAGSVAGDGDHPLQPGRDVRHAAEFAQPPEPDHGSTTGDPRRRRRSPDARSHGFVSSCNATNLFWVRSEEVHTSTGIYCFNGVTRGVVIASCGAEGVAIRLGDFPLEDVLAADEVFVTGTFGGITPVRSVDGHVMPAPLPGPVTERLIAAYAARKDAEARA